MTSELLNPPRGAREGWLPGHREGHVWKFDRDVVLAWVKAHPAGSGRQADEVDMKRDRTKAAPFLRQSSELNPPPGGTFPFSYSSQSDWSPTPVRHQHVPAPKRVSLSL